ncbi:MAG: cytochrome c nitrite reductase small subunit [Bryobacterales bacterium]|nr:cytochrome c nitrite reductase small subunit [Bryobacterales bacterium]
MTRKTQSQGVITVVLLGSLLGLCAGTGLFTFGYAQGAAYLTNDPAACVNCHVMREQYDGWIKGSHRKAAVCNDCHAPHSFVPKYYTKALNGFFHSLAFTTQQFPDHIQITERNARITRESCRHCHSEIVSGIDAAHPGQTAKTDCVRCHRDVGHLH